MEIKKMQKFTLDQIEYKYRNGIITQDDYEHYCYHWQNETFRYSAMLENYQASICPVCNQKFN